MRSAILVLIIALSFSIKGNAQINVFLKSKAVDSLRYHNYKGSPYLYKNWQVADIESRDSTFYKHVMLNYNGYDNKFEVMCKYGIVALSEDLYDTITVYRQDSKTGEREEWFIRGLHYDIATSLANVIYKSDSLTLVRFFHVRVSEASNEIYGDNTIHRKFIPSSQYAVLYRSKFFTGKMNWYKLGLIFNDQPLVDSIIENNKIKLSKEKDLIRFMEIMDQQLK